jgi:SAM-dependent methyltransferase
MLTVRSLRHYIGKTVDLTTKPFPRGHGILRYRMYERLGEIGAALSVKTGGNALSISHSRHLAPIMGVQPATWVDANFPEQDILNLGFADEQFDWVFSDQVLEHVAGSPQAAIDQSLRVLKPGGIAVHTTAFIVPLHDKPGDFWRFTPQALTLLCGGFSEVIASEGWGNPLIWPFAAFGLAQVKVPETRWHPINALARHNNTDWPICTWVVARK